MKCFILTRAVLWFDGLGAARAGGSRTSSGVVGANSIRTASTDIPFVFRTTTEECIKPYEYDYGSVRADR
eukprot:scaffold85491_cov22-Prasinocladus_malaysianus.AAC.1